MIKYLTYIIILAIIAVNAEAQIFINPDLDGNITGPSSLPDNWQNVPATDINCEATVAGFNDTPDLTDLYRPNASNGTMGNPYSGTTFVSGLKADDFHEGIMQTVTGFTPNNTYIINFQQSVVKQINCLDQSGSWAVYVDDVLAGITLPTFSNAAFNSTSFIWESRNITFTATANTHTIKFLPYDDDNNNSSSLSDISGGLRVGIDNINFINNYVADKIIIQIPNLFTPNNDGINDLFTPIISNGIIEMTTTIYNRWGSKVFDTNDLWIKWDGIMDNNHKASGGVYFWVVTYTDIKGNKLNMKGYLTILY